MKVSTFYSSFPNDAMHLWSVVQCCLWPPGSLWSPGSLQSLGSLWFPVPSVGGSGWAPLTFFPRGSGGSTSICEFLQVFQISLCSALLHFVLAPLCENRSNKHGRLLISFSVLQCDFSHSGTREQNEILHNKRISTETCKTMQCKPQLHRPLFNPLETSAHSP